MHNHAVITASTSENTDDRVNRRSHT